MKSFCWIWAEGIGGMFKKLLLATIILAAWPVQAQQQILVPTRPITDSSNAAASTAFVTNQFTGGGGQIIANTFPGVDPTGATDSTTGLQNAANAAIAANATLLMCGSYFTHAAITFGSGSARVLGCSVTGAVLALSNATQDGFDFNGTSFCAVNYMTIKNKTGVTMTGGIGVSLSSAGYCDVSFNNFTGLYDGVISANSTGSFIRFNSFTNRATAVNGETIGLTGTDVAAWVEFNIANTSGSAPTFGIALTGAVQGEYINDNQVLHYTYGLYISPSTGNNIQNLFLNHNSWDSNVSYGALYDGTNGNIWRVKSTNEWFAATSNGPGMQTQSSGGNAISALQMVAPIWRANSKSGVYFLGTVNDVSISSFIASANNSGVAGSYNGMEIGAAASHFTIDGGITGPTANESNVQAYGIVLQSGGSDYLNIHGVDASINLTAGILNQSTGVHNQFWGNAGIPGTTTSATVSLSGDVSLTNVANFFDGPSANVGTTGTFCASGTVTVSDTAGAAVFAVKLYDGTTSYASTVVSTNAANQIESATVSGCNFTPAGNVRVAVKDFTSVSGLIKANSSGVGKDSSVSVWRTQ